MKFIALCINCGKIINDEDSYGSGVSYWHGHCPESAPEGVRSNDLISEREHLASEEPLSQRVESEASTRAIGAESELLLLPCPIEVKIAKYLVSQFWLGAEIGIGNSSIRDMSEEQYFEINHSEWTNKAKCLIEFIRAGLP